MRTNISKIIKDTSNDAAGKALLSILTETWEQYKNAEKQKMYEQAHNLENKYYEVLNQLQKFPHVGCPCTVFYYSDSRAGQIVEVKGNRFKVQALKYHVENNNGERKCIVDNELENQLLGWYSYRKSGKAYQVGSEAKQGNTCCVLGFKITDIDFNN